MVLQESVHCFDSDTGLNQFDVRVVADKEEGTLVDAYDLSLHVKHPFTSKVTSKLAIKPSSVFLVDDYLPDAKINTFYGRVISVEKQEELVAVDVDINDIIIRAVMMKSFSKHLDIVVGRIIAIILKPEHLFFLSE